MDGWNVREFKCLYKHATGVLVPLINIAQVLYIIITIWVSDRVSQKAVCHHRP